MTVVVAQAVVLTAPSVPEFGTLFVDQIEGDFLGGTFAPGADFPAVEPAFREWAEVVEGNVLSLLDKVDASPSDSSASPTGEGNVLSLLDKVDAAVIALGIRLADGTPVWDVQIYPDGAASCRVGARGERNGAH